MKFEKAVLPIESTYSFCAWVAATVWLNFGVPDRRMKKNEGNDWKTKEQMKEIG